MPKGSVGIAVLLLIIALVLFLNFRDLADWENSDVIALVDFAIWLIAIGWLLWPRQPGDSA
jgi:hypothetical protein